MVVVMVIQSVENIEIPTITTDQNGFEIVIGDYWHEEVLEVSSEIRRIELNCKWIDERRNDRIGIFLPSSDSTVRNEIVTSGTEFRQKNQNDISGILIDNQRWKFGRTANVTLHKIRSEKSVIKFQILLKPVFHPKPIRELEISINGYTEHEKIDSDFDIKKIIKLSSNGKLPETSKVIKQIENLGGYNNEGEGNSIHPKQIMTIKALKYCLKKVKSQNKIKIAYIGTDTIENLTSVMRYITKNNLWTRIECITGYSEDKWDDPIVDLIENLGISTVIDDDKIDIHPHNDYFRESAEKHDIVIATYVIPFVSRNEISNFQILLDNLLVEGGDFVSVDPINLECSVRSPIYGEGQENTQSIAKNLNLLHSKNIKGKSCEAMIYKKTCHSGGN